MKKVLEDAKPITIADERFKFHDADAAASHCLWKSL
jgi:hypothetical protein